MDIYEACPAYESERFRLRLVENEDLEDLLRNRGENERGSWFLGFLL